MSNHSLGYFFFFRQQTLRRLFRIFFCKFQWKYLPLIKEKYLKIKYIDPSSIQLIRRPFDKVSAATMKADSFEVLNIKETFQENKWTVNQSPLWMFHLHDFDYILGAENPTKIILSWIEQVPFGLYVAWHAYPTSLRICNWIWAYSDSKLDLTNQESQVFLNSIVNQTQFLYDHLEVDKGGNHLIENIKALITSGVFFKNEKFLKKGISLLKKELKTQIFSDGCHFERSPMYHIIVMECVMSIKEALVINKTPLQPLDEILDKMAAYLYALCHNTHLPLFHDSALGRAMPLSDVYRLCPLNSNIKNAKLRDSGFRVLKDKGNHLIMDVGDMSPKHHPGHSHNGYGHFLLYSHDTLLISDGGVYTYDPNPDRLAYRNTAAHNATRVKNTEHNELWGSFRSGRRGKVLKVIERTHYIECHFRDFKGNNMCRIIDYDPMNATYTIIDTIKNIKEACKVESYIHFTENTVITSQTKNQFDCTIENVHFSVDCSILTNCKIAVKDTHYSEEMGKLKKRLTLKIEGLVLPSNPVIKYVLKIKK